MGGTPSLTVENTETANSPAFVPLEIMHLLTADEAAEYGLVPYRLEGGLLSCYGAAGREYSRETMELEVLSGLRVRVTPLPVEAFRQLLQRCCARESPRILPPESLSADSSTPQAFLLSLLEEALRTGASDIHFEPGGESGRIRFRIDGQLTVRCVLERRRLFPLVARIKTLSGIDTTRKGVPQEGRMGYRHAGTCVGIRVATLPTVSGEMAVLHLHRPIPALSELHRLGFSDRQFADYCRIVDRRSGLVLVCGPEGAGKRTTLHATLRRLNRTADHILTVEDPVTCRIEGISQIAVDEMAGVTPSAAIGMFLRQDSDVILVDEIRDPETARMAVRAAQTGRLVLSTLPVRSAWGAAARLTDMGVPACLVADTLAMSVTQRLVRLLCPCCKRRTDASEAVRTRIPEADACFEPVGCEQCRNTGYAGRRAVFEVIPFTGEFAAAIRSGTTEIRSLLRERGCRTLADSAAGLFLDGATSFEEAVRLLED